MIWRAESAVADAAAMTYLLSRTTHKPLALLLSLFCLAGMAGTVGTLALDAPPAYAGTNDDSI